MGSSLTTFVHSTMAATDEQVTTIENDTHAVSSPGFIEKSFSIFVLSLTTGAVVGMIGQSPYNLDAEGQGNLNVLWLRVIWIVIYCLTICLLIAHRKAALRSLSANKFLSVLFVLPLLSTAWSYTPEISLKQGVVMLGTSLFGLYFGSRYSIPDQLLLLARALAFIIILSVLTVVLLPDYGVSHGVHFGNWRGVFTHKNHFGRFMALSVFVFLMLSRSGNRIAFKRARMWFGISLLLVLLSGSETAIAATFIVLGLSPFLKVLRRPMKQLVGFGASALAVMLFSAPILLRQVGTVLKLLGRDATMSGRIFLWMGLGFRVLQRPWLGYGFEGFWTSDLVRPVWLLIGWTPGHAHDGFLELCLDLGIFGCAIFLGGFAVVAVRARALLLKTPKSLESVWSRVFLLFFLVYNVPECCLLVQNELFWVLFVGIATALPLTQWMPNPAKPCF